jgi:hypothetical protein
MTLEAEKVCTLVERIGVLSDRGLLALQKTLEAAKPAETTAELVGLAKALAGIESKRRGLDDIEMVIPLRKTDQGLIADITPAKLLALLQQEPEQDEEHREQVDLLPVDKADEDKQIVFGEVLVPEKEDLHGSLISADEIERAAHLWLARFQDRGQQHDRIVNSKMEIFESYLAPTNLTIGGRKVKKGTWLLMLHVTDDALWKDVKDGKFTGFSMGGFARKVPAAKAQ